jgi:non-specific serine/threonine protein kinase
MADAQVRLGGLDRARSLLFESEALSDDPLQTADLEHPIFVKLAMAAWGSGDIDSARPLFERGVAVARAERDVHTKLLCLRYLGVIARQEGDLSKSRALHEEALAGARELEDYPCTMYCLAGLAYLASESTDAPRSARLLGAISRLHELTGMTLAPSSTTAGFDQYVADIRGVLGEEAFNLGWNEGRSMPLDRAVAVALGE